MSDVHIRQQLVNMLTVPQAHMTFDDAVKNFPLDHINSRPDGVEYTFWHLLEHLRICQRDILDYSHSSDYKELNFPDDLWPARDATTDAAGWQHTIDQFRTDLAAFVALIKDSNTDLMAPIPHGYDGHTIFREVLVLGDHNAYHIGEFGILRGIMGLW